MAARNTTTPKAKAPASALVSTATTSVPADAAPAAVPPVDAVSTEVQDLSTATASATADTVPAVAPPVGTVPTDGQAFEGFGWKGNTQTTTGGDTSVTAKSTTVVYVYANLCHGQSFRLPGGKEVTLKGYPISKLRDENGNALPAGQYGVTAVPAEEWEQVMKVYSELTVMQSGLIFAAASREEGDAMAAERQGLRHGLEPVDPKGKEVVTTPDETKKEGSEA